MFTPIQFGKTPRPESFEQETPPPAKRPKITTVAHHALTVFPSADPEIPAGLLRILRQNPHQLKKANIWNNCWHYNGESHPLVRLGQGKDHVVWGFDSNKTIKVAITDGTKKPIPLAQVVIKSFVPDKLNKISAIVHQLKEDQNARTMVREHFRLIGRAAPVAKLLVSSLEMQDPTTPSNGTEIWERCFSLNANDPALWEWVRDLLTESVRFGLEHGTELAGSFRPDNVMQRSDSKFVIIDSSTAKNAEPLWQQRVARYVKEWCEFCQKTEAELTESWPVEFKEALKIQADESSDVEIPHHPLVNLTPVNPSLLFHD